MKNLQTRKMKTSTKLLAVIFITIILLAGLLYAVKSVNSWFEHNYFQFTQPVEVKLNQPITIQERVPQIKRIVFEYPGEVDTDIKKYICEKFGVYDCKIALAIVQAESGFNDQAIGVNSNKSIDLGLWQINFPTHKGTITPADALDPYKATDWAFEKYQRDGNFNAWVVYTTNRYLVNL